MARVARCTKMPNSGGGYSAYGFDVTFYDASPKEAGRIMKAAKASRLTCWMTELDRAKGRQQRYNVSARQACLSMDEASSGYSTFYKAVECALLSPAEPAAPDA